MLRTCSFSAGAALAGRRGPDRSRLARPQRPRMASRSCMTRSSGASTGPRLRLGIGERVATPRWTCCCSTVPARSARPKQNDCRAGPYFGRITTPACRSTLAIRCGRYAFRPGHRRARGGRHKAEKTAPLLAAGGLVRPAAFRAPAGDRDRHYIVRSTCCTAAPPLLRAFDSGRQGFNFAICRTNASTVSEGRDASDLS